MTPYIETPPYARGIRWNQRTSNIDGRNTPVCTGNTVMENKERLENEKHPRMHGEY